MFFYVRLWQDINHSVPTVQQRVQAPSEGHAVVQVMKAHHLTSVDRAWVSRSVYDEPTVRLIQVVVKGKVRSWRQESHFLTAHASR